MIPTEISQSWFFSLPLWIIIPAVIWTFVWKGFALWKSARRNEPIWFVALLIINTFGLLEILYIFVFSKMNKQKSSQSKTSKKKRI